MNILHKQEPAIEKKRDIRYYYYKLTHSVESSNQWYWNPSFLIHVIPQKNISTQIIRAAKSLNKSLSNLKKTLTA